MHGTHLISHWSRTQVGIALSSKEAELNAALKMASELVGLKNSLEEWGHKVKVEVLGDSSPLQGLLERRGTGKIKHLSMIHLWLQERVRAREIEYRKVPSPSDALTHHWTEKEGVLHFTKRGLNSSLRNSARYEAEGWCVVSRCVEQCQSVPDWPKSCTFEGSLNNRMVAELGFYLAVKLHWDWTGRA